MFCCLATRHFSLGICFLSRVFVYFFVSRIRVQWKLWPFLKWYLFLLTIYSTCDRTLYVAELSCGCSEWLDELTLIARPEAPIRYWLFWNRSWLTLHCFVFYSFVFAPACALYTTHILNVQWPKRYSFSLIFLYIIFSFLPFLVSGSTISDGLNGQFWLSEIYCFSFASSSSSFNPSFFAPK